MSDEKLTARAEIGAKPFDEADDDGYRLATVDVYATAHGFAIAQKPQARVVVAIRDEEGQPPELLITHGPIDPEALGMNLAKEIKFSGDVALAVLAVLGLACRQLAGAGRHLSGGDVVTIDIKD